MKTMTSKFPGFCQTCKQKFPAGTLITWSKATGAAHSVCPPAPKAPEPVAAVDVANIVAFLRSASKLKFPKLRVLDPHSTGELTLAPSSKYPGALFVRDATAGRIGGIKADGQPFGAIANDSAMLDHLRKVNAAPLDAAKRYAAIKCNCSFCSLPLTDEASVEAGYGPVCAKHYGLPHKAKGTVELKHVDEAPEPEQQDLSPVDELLGEQPMSDDEAEAQARRAMVAAAGLW